MAPEALPRQDRADLFVEADGVISQANRDEDERKECCADHMRSLAII
jgi:hypothetical protein